MKKRYQKIKNACKNSDKKTLTIYIILRILTIICMIRELANGNIQNALLCILSLILFLLPVFIEKKFKVDLPSILEIFIFLFIFAAEILGEINNFYGTIPFWDTILHTINGFLCASVGFSLVYILNEKTNLLHLSPLFVALVAFCFSMTVGALWEVFEYSMDNIFKWDMQKDEYVYNIQTVTLDPENNNNVIAIKNIDHTILYDKNNNEIIKIDGYLDIGLNDTIEDLIVNLIGAITFSIFGYLYIINQEKYKLAGAFITKKKQ